MMLPVSRLVSAAVLLVIMFLATDAEQLQGPSGPPGALRASGTTGKDGVQDAQEFVRWTGRKGLRKLQGRPVGPGVGPRGPPRPRDATGDDGWTRATGPKGDTESTGDTGETSATGVLVQVIRHRVRRQGPGAIGDGGQPGGGYGSPVGGYGRPDYPGPGVPGFTGHTGPPDPCEGRGGMHGCRPPQPCSDTRGPCESPPPFPPGPDQWSSWSSWSSCLGSCVSYATQHRTRRCIGHGRCDGSSTDTRTCVPQGCRGVFGPTTRYPPAFQRGHGRPGCPGDQFLCFTDMYSYCIPRRAVCDGNNDCTYHEDEWNCPCRDKFRCRNSGRCIPRQTVCDGNNDCGDRSDERYCECQIDYFQCHNTGHCIPTYYSCDHADDCGDRSDEHCPRGFEGPTSAVHGKWSSWSIWSRCSASCGNGTQRRTRRCDNPAPRYGGRSCGDSSSNTRPCNLPACPVNGQWSNWSSWSRCSVSCGYGTRRRTRRCDNPAPRYGGRRCGGSSTDTTTCFLRGCRGAPVTVRLVGGSDRAGRLEVYYNGVWGTVCDDYFNNVAARVACNSLGFGFVGHETYNVYGYGSGRIWLDNVRCSGNESSLGQCRNRGWGVHDCSHREDVAISCPFSTTPTIPSTTTTTSTTTATTTTTSSTTTTTTTLPSVTGCRDRNPSECNQGRSACYHDSYRSTCCSTCYVDGPAGCEFGDKATWCANQQSSGPCYNNYRTCCKTCKRFETGRPGCKYGDAVNWCSGHVRTLSDCQNPHYTQRCCQTCFNLQKVTTTQTTRTSSRVTTQPTTLRPSLRGTPQPTTLRPSLRGTTQPTTLRTSTEGCNDKVDWCAQHNPGWCYRPSHRAVCCDFCSRHENPSQPRCRYGDKFQWCDRRYCSTNADDCCATC